MFDGFNIPWFLTVAIGPVLLAIVFIWALMRRRKARVAPTLPPDHPARHGGEDERIKTP